MEQRFARSAATLLAIVVVVLYCSCGTIRNTNNYRWYVKTTTDRDSGLVQYAVVRATSVREQTRLPMPALTEDSARQSCEETVYVLDGLLIALKIEGDGDYHLIVKDTAVDSTMLVEIPNPDADWTSRCGRSDQFRAARATIDNIAGIPTGSLRHLPTPIRLKITGIGFFDPEHFSLSKEGMAANRREIHPVLRVERE